MAETTSGAGAPDGRTRRGSPTPRWDDFLNQFAPATDAALAKYHLIRDLAPVPDRVIDELIAHEEALQQYAAAEMQGDRGRSLEPVRAVIERLSSSPD